jgi:hypothetical protein
MERGASARQLEGRAERSLDRQVNLMAARIRSGGSARRTPTWHTVLALLVAACAPAISTRTARRPDAELGRLRTFAVLPAPDASTPDVPSAMRPGPVAARLLHDAVEDALRERGYRESSRAPDFLVAYFAGLGDVQAVPAVPGAFSGWSRRLPGPVKDGGGGSVVIDVIDTRTRQLVWRGQGAATLPARADDASERVARTVRAVVGRFPRAASGR